MTPNKTPLWIAAALLAILAYRNSERILPQPIPPAPDTPAPSAELQAAVQPVKALLAGHKDADAIGAYCEALARYVGRSDATAKTTGQLRTLITASVPMMFSEGTKGGPPGIAAAMNAVVAGQLGSDDKEYDKAKAAATFRALAWAAGG